MQSIRQRAKAVLVGGLLVFHLFAPAMATTGHAFVARVGGITKYTVCGDRRESDTSSAPPNEEYKRDRLLNLDAASCQKRIDNPPAPANEGGTSTGGEESGGGGQPAGRKSPNDNFLKVYTNGAEALVVAGNVVQLRQVCIRLDAWMRSTRGYVFSHVQRTHISICFGQFSVSTRRSETAAGRTWKARSTVPQTL